MSAVVVVSDSVVEVDVVVMVTLLSVVVVDDVVVVVEEVVDVVVMVAIVEAIVCAVTLAWVAFPPILELTIIPQLRQLRPAITMIAIGIIMSAGLFLNASSGFATPRLCPPPAPCSLPGAGSCPSCLPSNEPGPRTLSSVGIFYWPYYLMF